MAEKIETVRAVVIRDFWPQADVRVTAGTVIDVSKDELIDGMEKGLLARAANANS